MKRGKNARRTRENGGKTGANLVGTVHMCQAVAWELASALDASLETTPRIARKIPLSRVIANRLCSVERAHDPVSAPVSRLAAPRGLTPARARVGP